MTLVIASCPHCSGVNELVALELTDDEAVMCSYCHKPLGQWGDLARESANRKPHISVDYGPYATERAISVEAAPLADGPSKGQVSEVPATANSPIVTMVGHR